MSTYRAIAGVSSTLRRLLRDRMEDPGAATVTIAPPDVNVANAPGNRLNLYLFHLSENRHLRNQEIPGNGHPGDYGLPPLSLDLQYLVTAYGRPEVGADADLQAQLILADAMRVLHDHSVVSEGLKVTRAAVGPVGTPILDPSLLGEFEKVKVVLHSASLEDVTKLWSVLPQASFRRSVVYLVSAVQIESRRQRVRALPVKTRRVHVFTLDKPELTAVYRKPTTPADPVGDARARVGDTLSIEGRGFVSDKTWVRIGSLEPIQLTPPVDSLIDIQVPDDAYPPDADHPVSRPIPAGERLQPGPHTVQVLVRAASEIVEGGLGRGTVVAGEDVQGSNHLAFTLLPTVTSLSPSSGGSSSVLTVTGKRLFGAGLKSVVFVGSIGVRVRAASAPGESWAAPSPTQVQVPVSAFVAGGLTAGTYPVHVVVNGAQSLEEPTFQLT